MLCYIIKMWIFLVFLKGVRQILRSELDAKKARNVEMSLRDGEWALLQFMAKTKGKSSIGELFAEIASHYLLSLEKCPICEANERLRPGCTGCNGEGFLEQMTLRVLHVGG
jgi:hypothetical protein